MSFAENDSNGQQNEEIESSQTESSNGEFVEGGEEELPPLDEPKKSRVSTTTLLMIGVLAVGAAGMWTMVHRIGAANAAPVTAETAQAKKTINAFLDNGSSSMKTMQMMLQSTEKIVQQFLSYPSMTQVPLCDLHTNPFRMRAPAPIASSDAAERRRREEQRVAMLKSVQTLQLQSIMVSESRKACLINGTMYRENDQVEAFSIEKITPTSVVVKGGIYRFELKMQK